MVLLPGGDAMSGSLIEVGQRCPFWALIGTQDPGAMPSFVIAVRDQDGPVPIAPSLLAEMVGIVRAGGVVLVMSDRREIRSRAKLEIMSALAAVAAPVAGNA